MPVMRYFQQLHIAAHCIEEMKSPQARHIIIFSLACHNQYRNLFTLFIKIKYFSIILDFQTPHIVAKQVYSEPQLIHITNILFRSIGEKEFRNEKPSITLANYIDVILIYCWEIQPIFQFQSFEHYFSQIQNILASWLPYNMFDASVYQTPRLWNQQNKLFFISKIHPGSLIAFHKYEFCGQHGTTSSMKQNYQRQFLLAMLRTELRDIKKEIS